MASSRLIGSAGRLVGVITPGVLENLRYRRLWLSGVIFYQARWMEVVVTGWVVLVLTGSATAVGLVGFFRTVPMLVFGLAFGSLADRFPRLHVLLTLQSISLLCTTAFAVVFFFEWERLWLLCLLAGIIGSAWAADFSARRALISELNTPETTSNAMSLEALSMHASRITAPVIGGVALGVGSAPVAYICLSVIFAASIAQTLTLRGSLVHRPAAYTTNGSAIQFVREGFSTVLRIPIVQLALLVTFLMNLLILPYQHLIALVAADILSVGPGRMGVLASASGVGAAAMAAFLTFKSRAATAKWFYVGGSMTSGLLLIVLATSTNYTLSLVVQVALGTCFGAFTAMQAVLIMNAVEPEVRARAMGILAMAIGMMPLGILTTGFLSSLIGVSLTIGGMAALATCLLLLIVFRYREVFRE